MGSCEPNACTSAPPLERTHISAASRVPIRSLFRHSGWGCEPKRGGVDPALEALTRSLPGSFPGHAKREEGRRRGGCEEGGEPKRWGKARERERVGGRGHTRGAASCLSSVRAHSGAVHGAVGLTSPLPASRSVSGGVCADARARRDGVMSLLLSASLPVRLFFLSLLPRQGKRAAFRVFPRSFLFHRLAVGAPGFLALAAAPDLCASARNNMLGKRINICFSGREMG